MDNMMARNRRTRNKPVDPIVEPGSRLAEMVERAQQKPLEPSHSGLNRDVRRDTRFRDTLDKFDHEATLSDDELRRLIHYYGILIRLTELTGQRYYLIRADALDQHRKLCVLASARGWTQALINMYGVVIEEVLDRII